MIRTTQIITQAASIIVILVGCLVLVGWSLDITVLKSMLPGHATMKANAALGFILAGISLGLGTGKRRVGKRRQGIGRRRNSSRFILYFFSQGCAIAIFLIGFLTLSQYLFGWNLDIDELLFRDSPISPATEYPGRMGDNTAINFMLVGAALWLLGRKTRRSTWLAQIFSSIAAFVALLAIAGYAFRVEGFYRFFFYSTSMALHTALTFGVLCIGILFARSDRGFMQPITSTLNGGVMARQLMLSAIVIPLSIAWLINQGQRAGHYDPALSLSLLAVLLNIVFVGLIWRNAIYLNKLDSERRRSSVRMHSSEERLKIAQKAANAGWWDWGLVSNRASCSEEYFELHGLDPKVPHCYENWLACIVEEDRERVDRQVREALERRTEVNIEFRVQHPQRGIRWLNAIGRTFYNAEGQPVQMTGITLDITDRKLAEETLRRSEERFRVSQELSLDAFTTLRSVRDESGAIVDFEWTYANPKAGEILRHRAEDLVGQRLLQVLPGNKINSELFERYVRVVSTGEPHDIELFYDAEGIRGWFRNMSVKLNDGVAIFFSDITERKLAEEALRESERRFRRLVESNIFGVAFGDFNGGIHDANDAFLQIIGYDRDQMLSGQLRWDRLTPPEFLHMDLQAQAELKQRGVCTPFEKEFIRSDGRRVPILIGAVLLEEPYDRQQEIVAFFLDLSEQKRAQEELREGKQIFEALMEYIPEGITIADAPDVNIRLVSKYGQKLIGRSRQTLERIPVEQHVEQWDIFHADGVTRPSGEELPLTRAIQQGEVVMDEEWVLQQPNGNKINILCNAGPIRDRDGRVTGGVIAWRDISDRKQAQLQLQQQAKELSQLNATLTQTTELLVERNQELDRFVYVVSHDLKAPLRAIVNLSKWIEEDLDGQLSEDSQRHMELLRSRVYRMEALIDGLLEYSRVGRTEVATVSVDVGELLDEVIDSLAPPPTFTIQVRLPMPTIVAKRLLLTQVFSNLISNAIKHHHRPDGRIEIFATDKGDYYEFAVTDDGPGIAPGHHDKIFGIFQTLKSRDIKENTGIGLSIVKKILETEGGGIDLESEPGKGTTFRFTWLKQHKTPTGA
jgi:PAS domain S-box-containing protein